MIGIIGGYGIHEILEDTVEKDVDTPYGKPSGMLLVGKLGNRDVCLLPRHGEKHTIPPHSINFRANIHAMKGLGVDRIIAVSAVGSLKEDYKPGEVAVLDQFIDFTKRREYTFHDNGEVYHVGVADPFCPELREVAVTSMKGLGIAHKAEGTYICIGGPRFSTRAESRMFKDYADVIGMTLVPEVTLAREKEICYTCLAMVTDYDVWKDKPVDIAQVIKVMADNNENIKDVLKDMIPKIPAQRECGCKDAMKHAKV